MDIEEIKQIMKNRDYKLYSTNGDKTCFDFVDENGISARVMLVNSDTDWQIKLSFMYGLLTISTDFFSFDHPRFKDVFEQQIINAFVRLNN